MPLIYLVRHGIAEDRSATGRDEDRELTQVGMDNLQRGAAGLAWLEVKPDAIWSSPLRRARQTAEILRNAIAPGLELVIEPGLRSEADVEVALERLQANATARALMLVGHEPNISALASALLTGDVSAARMPFKPGSVLALEQTLPPSGRGTLRWFMTPEQLRRLGG
ncbi:MAG TPA: phosphohistidine phosphatase SixA [Polyangiales bacterium]|nr:phosphohistidine phosphatase SixA [Polyangiales bacterium]